MCNATLYSSSIGNSFAKSEMRTVSLTRMINCFQLQFGEREMISTAPQSWAINHIYIFAASAANGCCCLLGWLVARWKELRTDCQRRDFPNYKRLNLIIYYAPTRIETRRIIFHGGNCEKMSNFLRIVKFSLDDDESAPYLTSGS
jgi:hypothetical protein